ncbi:MAG: epoxyqueuosine reductase QueH [Ruminococcus sp.]|nr:epoxyqueuosine reductase QueH [Ruminococcus sp.]MDE6848676.1 epoxyqueuosine reductase QueH [Ruminococcus sp.]MDE7137678.1 epoxyqueuosine reductase QueH [Ruminococcus sp.]
MEKVNYGKILDEKLSELEKNGEQPSLLLHACCAPCSSHTLTYLERYFDITIYFCNPNISPENEFLYRFEELKRLVREMNLDTNVIEEPYDPLSFYELAKGLETLPERSERCRKCIAYRLRMAGEKAKQLGADYFTTTLTISPHKDCTFINECGAEISEEFGVKYLFSDFKKHDGYKHSIELSKQYNLYRQNYCGCIYSKINSQK